MERIEKQRRELFLKRETKIRTIDQESFSIYEKIRRWVKIVQLISSAKREKLVRVKRS